MQLKFHYQETPQIRQLINEIEALKMLFDILPPVPHIEKTLQRESLLKSALYSARIEGNPLQIADTASLNNKSKNKLEVFNLFATYQSLPSLIKKYNLSFELLSELHKKVLNGLAPHPGTIRSEPWAIFNEAGIAIYLAPPASQVSELLHQLILFITTSTEPPPIKSAIAHFLFEKIHPYEDGNGRVGRLLSAAILHKNAYAFKGLISIEEIIEKNRDTYYATLEPEQDVISFVEFFLESLVQSIKIAQEKLQNHPPQSPGDSLLPRRRELLEVIREHPECSFDFIHRRFTSINPKTLHYDLKQLQDKGFIIKLGATRGSVYKVRI